MASGDPKNVGCGCQGGSCRCWNPPIGEAYRPEEFRLSNEAHVEFTEDGRVLSRGTATVKIDTPDRGSVLEEAARIVAGPRQAAYGHPRDNHACTAAMWTAYLDRRAESDPAEADIDAVDVCVLNVLQKLSRFANTRQRDSIVDAAGFLANIEMILDGKWDGGT